MPRRMTKGELALAQHLYGTYRDSHDWAERLDPRRRARKGDESRRGRMALELDALTRIASEAFMHLCGQHPSRVDMTDLNTENPAAWTKEITYPEERLVVPPRRRVV